MLRKSSNPEVYDVLVVEFGEPLYSRTMLSEPRNIKQIKNRKAAGKRQESTEIKIAPKTVVIELKQLLKN